MSIAENYTLANNYLNSKVNYEAFSNPALSTYKMTLESLIAIDQKLNLPHQNLKIIHVAGTKGKGSVCSLIEFYLRSQGFSTGLFTSPHLYKVNERVRINGNELTDLQFSEMISEFREAIDPVDDKKLSYFETMTLAAFLYFKKLKLDWIVLETGLGGRLDATNIVKPIISVITRIDLDHTHLLGNTHALIAAEKAGIIKENTPVIALYQRPDVNEVFEKFSILKNAPLIFASANLAFKTIDRSLNSAEIENLSLAHTVLSKLKELSYVQINEKNLNALSTLKIPGRYEVFTFKNKLIMLDVAHNFISYEKLIEKIKQNCPHQKVAFAFNSARDKDMTKMGELVKKNFTEIYLLPVKDNPRLYSPKELSEVLQTGKAFQDLNLGIDEILATTSADLIVFTGSFYLIGQVGRYFNRATDSAK